MAFNKFTIEEGSRDLSILIRWDSEDIPLIGFFFAFAFNLAWPIYYVISFVFKTDIPFVMDLGICSMGIVGLVILYSTLCEILNTTKVVFSKKTVILDYGPLPVPVNPFVKENFLLLPHHQEFYQSEIEDIYIVQTKYKLGKTRGTRKTLGLKLETEEDKTLLVSHDESELDLVVLQEKIEEITQRKVLRF